MSEVAASANRRGARAVLCAAAALAGIAAVLAVASREPARRRAAIAQPPATVGVAALPAPVATLTGSAVRAEEPPTGAGVEPPVAWPWPPPVATTLVRRDEAVPAAPPVRVDPPSVDGDDGRERAATGLGRQAVDDAVSQTGVGHSDLESAAKAVAPEASAPVVPLSSTAAGGAGSEGWDGGAFWFGPRGLVRMMEAQP